MGYNLYVNPLEQMQENLAGIGESYATAKDKKRARAAEAIAREQQQANTDADNARAEATNQQAIKQHQYEAKVKQIDAVDAGGGYSPDDYLKAINDAGVEYGISDIGLEANPEYNKPVGFFQTPQTKDAQGNDIPKYRPKGKTKEEKELETYGAKKEIDNTYDLKNKAIDLKNKKQVTRIDQNNAIKRIKTTGGITAANKGVPTYADTLREKENAPDTSNDLSPEFKKTADDYFKEIFKKF